MCSCFRLDVWQHQDVQLYCIYILHLPTNLRQASHYTWNLNTQDSIHDWILVTIKKKKPDALYVHLELFFPSFLSFGFFLKTEEVVSH